MPPSTTATAPTAAPTNLTSEDLQPGWDTDNHIPDPVLPHQAAEAARLQHLQQQQRQQQQQQQQRRQTSSSSPVPITSVEPILGSEETGSKDMDDAFSFVDFDTNETDVAADFSDLLESFVDDEQTDVLNLA